MPFDRLIRFVDEQDQVHYGNLTESLASPSIIGLDVELLSGSIETDFQPTGRRVKVKKVLSIYECRNSLAESSSKRVRVADWMFSF